MSFFRHNLRTCFLANDWSLMLNRCKNSDKQIEPVAPVTIRKHLHVHLRQSDISHPVLTNRKRILLEKNSVHCFIINVQIRHMIFL